MNSSTKRFTIVVSRLDTIEGQRFTLEELAQSWGALVDPEGKRIILPPGWWIGKYNENDKTKLIRDTRGQSRGMIRDAESLGSIGSKVWMGRLHPLNRYRIREIVKGRFVLFDNAKRQFVLEFTDQIGQRERYLYAATQFPNFTSPLINWDDSDIPIVK